MKTKILYFALCLILMLSGTAQPLWAAFGEDIEKPKPEFKQENGDWIAKLVPRGKSNPIQIRFHLEGGTIEEVKAMEFSPDQQPKVDPKNFRSDFFRVQASVPPGGEAALSASSEYFTSATELWSPKTDLDRQWQSAGAENVGLEDRVNQLTMKATDGGLHDADGKADGRVVVVFGPRDSFWGYALGTLLIRFFGIFLVLSILMVGMLLSGLVFRRLERSKTAAPAAAPGPEPAGLTAFNTRPDISGELAAAIALALHLHTARMPATAIAGTLAPGASAWSIEGRVRLMGDRMTIFDRPQR